MGLGITLLLRKIQIAYNIKIFSLRKSIFGFDNANAFLRQLDKNSMIPILIKNGACIGYEADIEAPLIFHNCNDFKNLVIGKNCHIGKNCFFDLRDKIIIEDHVVISMQCTFITHIDMTKSNLSTQFKQAQQPIIIKQNVYIGVNSTILKGVTLGESSFIAAGSVVTKNVEPFNQVGGVPARFLKNIEL
jgi:acetyltransferase-like isoleucine patch superfamily enzyme